MGFTLKNAVLSKTPGQQVERFRFVSNHYQHKAVDLSPFRS